MSIERTYVMIKPDGVQRGYIGKIIERFEQRGLKLIAMRLGNVTSDQVKTHYGFLSDKPFYGELVNFITSGPVVKMIWSGDQAVKAVRQNVGATNPLEAAPGTIRADFSIATGNNIIHASDSVESAEKEIANFFSAGEIVEYSLCREPWLGV